MMAGGTTSKDVDPETTEPTTNVNVQETVTTALTEPDQVSPPTNSLSIVGDHQIETSEEHQIHHDIDKLSGAAVSTTDEHMSATTAEVNHDATSTSEYVASTMPATTVVAENVQLSSTTAEVHHAEYVAPSATIATVDQLVNATEPPVTEQTTTLTTDVENGYHATAVDNSMHAVATTEPQNVVQLTTSSQDQTVKTEQTVIGTDPHEVQHIEPVSGDNFHHEEQPSESVRTDVVSEGASAVLASETHVTASNATETHASTVVASETPAPVVLAPEASVSVMTTETSVPVMDTDPPVQQKLETEDGGIVEMEAAPTDIQTVMPVHTETVTFTDASAVQPVAVQEKPTDIDIPMVPVKTEMETQHHSPPIETQQKEIVVSEGKHIEVAPPEMSTLQQVAQEQVVDHPTANADEVVTVKEETQPVDDVATMRAESQPGDDVASVWESNEADVLSGRGASVNAHQGNKKFRALCFSRKPEFEAGNHAAKRRIATEIVAATTANGARFLKKREDKGPWYEMTTDQAILKACQVMRDYKRPDRLAIREMMAQNGSARKRQRTEESTPMEDTPARATPLEPIIENPFGVHDHDILSGRGAFVNGHIGNQRLRRLALERKLQFDAGNYTEKRALATEIVQHIRQLDPPGRFLRRVRDTRPSKGEDNNWVLPPRGLDGTWEELSDEKAIHKACQVMRDIDRPDRKDREMRRKKKQKHTEDHTMQSQTQVPVKPPGTDINTETLTTVVPGVEVPQVKVEDCSEPKEATVDIARGESKDSIAILAETSTSAEKAAVEEAVAAAEAALDKALDDVPGKINATVTMDVAETAVV